MLDAGLQRVLVYTGGRAHNVAVLSAEVLRNENSVGCHRPEITLSWCWATTTLGKGIVRSPAKVWTVTVTRTFRKLFQRAGRKAFKRLTACLSKVTEITEIL